LIAFEYVAAGTVEEAVAALRQHREDAKVLAGGQSLVPLLNYRLARPRVVVDVNGLPLGGVAVQDGWLRLGALVRHHELVESPIVREHCPVLAEAAALVGNVRVRSLGTLGGSLAHADPAGELPMVTVALDARLTLVSAKGRRTLAARDFFRGALATALESDELLTQIEVPVTTGLGWAVEELARRAGDFAVAAATALVGLDVRGRVAETRLALGGVADRPLRAEGAEERLRGRTPTPEVLADAAQTARDNWVPASDIFASGAYRRHLARVLCHRALERAVARAARGGRGHQP
jgi:carbon-monoxide dehydrogenase medium subunit